MNFDQEYSKPTLIEPGIKYFLNETLKQCRVFKDKYNNTLFNISIFVIFILILGITLLVKYKGKLTPSEKQQKEDEKKQYILSKIHNYQQDKVRRQQELITGLPHWDNEYDVITQKNISS
jgi:hypothetical protein